MSAPESSILLAKLAMESKLTLWVLGAVKAVGLFDRRQLRDDVELVDPARGGRLAPIQDELPAQLSRGAWHLEALATGAADEADDRGGAAGGSQLPELAVQVFRPASALDREVGFLISGDLEALAAHLVDDLERAVWGRPEIPDLSGRQAQTAPALGLRDGRRVEQGRRGDAQNTGGLRQLGRVGRRLH